MEKLSTGQADCLIYPPLPGSAPLSPHTGPTVAAVAPPTSPAVSSNPFSQVLVGTEQACPLQPVTVPSGGQSSSNPASQKTAAVLDHPGSCQPPAAHASSSRAPPLQPPAIPSGPAPSAPLALSEEQVALEKVRDLLVKYSHGLWAPALPRLFSDTYKVPLPQHLVDDLSLLMDFCRVDYPMAHDKTKVRAQCRRQPVSATKTSTFHFSTTESGLSRSATTLYVCVQVKEHVLDNRKSCVLAADGTRN